MYLYSLCFFPAMRSRSLILSPLDGGRDICVHQEAGENSQRASENGVISTKKFVSFNCFMG
jgi:hypothetical protein